MRSWTGWTQLKRTFMNWKKGHAKKTPQNKNGMNKGLKMRKIRIRI